MIGKTISRYEILEKLGQGAMGTVYKARDLRLKRLVALKFLSVNISDNPEHSKRFEQEAMVISALAHPNIATIHDMEEVDGERFLVLEYLAGGSLRTRIKALRASGQELPIAQVFQYAGQMADGLAHAHARGIIHRDIKTDNIVLAADGRLRITDFGLARLCDQQSLTKSGCTVGTIAYMSPEQLSSSAVNQQSDIFSLGVVLYEITTGELPFQGENDFALMQAIVRDQPRPPRRIRPDTPDGLQQIILKALEKNPRNRYEQMADLLADLQRADAVLAGLHASGGGATTVTMGRQISSVRHNRRWLISLAAVLVLLISGAVWWTWFHRIPHEKSLAVLGFENIGGDASNQAFCDGLMEVLASKLTQLEQFQGSLLVVPTSDIRKESVTSVRAARRAFGVNLALTGSVQHTGNRMRVVANVVDATRMRQLQSRILSLSQGDPTALQDGMVKEIAEMLQLELQPQAQRVLATGNTAVPGAYEFYLQGYGYLRRLASPDDADHAIEEFRHSLALDSGYALAYAGLAEAYWRKYASSKNKHFIDEAWGAGKRAIELNDSLAPAHTTMGLLYAGTGHYTEAVKEGQKAIGLDPRNGDAYVGLGAAYEASGNPNAAEETYKKAINVRPGYWGGYNRLGNFFYRQDRYKDAVSAYQRVIQLAPDNPIGYTNLGGMQHLLGQDGEAEQTLKRSLYLKPTTRAYTNLGTVYFFQSRYAEALPLMEKATEAGSKDSVLWGNLADAYRWTSGQSGKAIHAYMRAIQFAARDLEVNRNDPELLSRLAAYWVKSGNAEKATATVQKVKSMPTGNKHVQFQLALV